MGLLYISNTAVLPVTPGIFLLFRSLVLIQLVTLLQASSLFFPLQLLQSQGSHLCVGEGRRDVELWRGGNPGQEHVLLLLRPKHTYKKLLSHLFIFQTRGPSAFCTCPSLTGHTPTETCPGGKLKASSRASHARTRYCILCKPASALITVSQPFLDGFCWDRTA